MIWPNHDQELKTLPLPIIGIIFSLCPSIIFLIRITSLLFPTITQVSGSWVAYGLGLVLGLVPGLVLALLAQQQGLIIMSQLVLIAVMEAIMFSIGQSLEQIMRIQVVAAVGAELMVGLLIRGVRNIGLWKMVLGIIIPILLVIVVGGLIFATPFEEQRACLILGVALALSLGMALGAAHIGQAPELAILLMMGAQLTIFLGASIHR